jgi:hypothetical protein
MTWETRLLDHFAEHVATEALVLDSYEDLARSAGSAYVEYLVRLIADDERRHHRIFTEITNTLRSQMGGSADAPQVPGVADAPTGDEFLAVTERFIEMERRDAVELERLRGELQAVGDTGLWGLLVDMMHLDTQKHLRILHFIRDRSIERRRSESET